MCIASAQLLEKKQTTRPLTIPSQIQFFLHSIAPPTHLHKLLKPTESFWKSLEATRLIHRNTTQVHKSAGFSSLWLILMTCNLLSVRHASTTGVVSYPGVWVRDYMYASTGRDVDEENMGNSLYLDLYRIACIKLLCACASYTVLGSCEARGSPTGEASRALSLSRKSLTIS